MPLLAHCSLAFHQMSFSKLSGFAQGVEQGLKKNSTVLDPLTVPVKDADLLILINNQINTHSAYKQGGKAQKPAFLLANAQLLSALNDIADYVDGIAVGDTIIITMAGYVPTNPGHSQSGGPLEQPVVSGSRGNSTGIIIVESDVFTKGCSFGCIVSEGKPLDQGVILNASGQFILPAEQTNRIIHDINNQRVKTFSGLTKGVDYYFYYYVVDTHYVSPLSDGLMIMSA